MKSRATIWIFALWILFTSGFLHAQDSTTLGEVLVSPTEDSAKNHHAGDKLFGTIVYAKEFEHQDSNLPAVLDQKTGVQIKRFGSGEDVATMSIRGSTSEQVQIYLDGSALNKSANGTVNLAQVPLELVERIEIYRGAAPARFASSSVGGVVNIVTKDAHKKRQTTITQAFSSFDTYNGSFLQTVPLKKVQLVFGYELSHSEGDFTYFDDNGTRFNTNDDKISTRNNNNFFRHSALVKFKKKYHDNLTFSGSNNFFQELRGIPGLANLKSDSATLGTLRNTSNLNLEKNNLFNYPWTVRLQSNLQWNESSFRDLQSDIGLGAQDNEDSTYQYGIKLVSENLLGKNHRFTELLSYSGEHFHPHDRVNPGSSGPTSYRHRIAAGLEDEISFFKSRLLVSPSVRTELAVNNSSDQSLSTDYNISGKLGTEWNIINNLKMSGHVSRSYRLPNFYELFGDRGTFIGNPQLENESSTNFDIGLIYPHKFQNVKINTSLVYFENRISNLIQMQQTSQLTVRAANIGKATIRGVELSANLDFWKRLNLSGNYSFQDARDRSNRQGISGRFLPGRPRHEANISTKAYNRWADIFLQISWMDANFLDSQNILKVSNRTLLNMGSSMKFKKNSLIISFEAKNLTNNRIVDVVGFPLPGRSYHGKLTVKI